MSGSGGFPRVFGTVVLLKPLAKDARTEVFLALRPEGAERLCVVTFLGRSLVSSPAVVDALKQQATWLVGRVHGSLVQIYDVGQSGDQLFFVSEYVEGGDVGELLPRVGVLSPGVVTFAGLELCEAFAFVRANEEAATGVRTRAEGLSVSSVMFARDGKVKLLHPGSCLAAPMGEVEGRGANVASMVAPENVDGVSTVSSDVYAVGAMLWQMLTGRPLAGTDAAGHLALLKAGTFRPRAPSSVVGASGSIPPEFDRLILKSLAARPQDRPRDFEAFRGELVAVMRNLPDADERSVRRLVVEAFSADLAKRATDLARLTAAASRPMETGPQPPSLTLTNLSGVRRRRAPETELVLGHTIPGTRYRALEKLGEGGMGAVYLAEHVDIERRVALKLLHSDLVQNPLVLRQFRQEARAASRIGNPYICDVTDWGEVLDGRVFFVMEYLDGASLAVILKEERRFNPARTIPILRQVAKALGAAHEKGIVHLDVKPDNVLLMERDGRQDAVKVVDFGIAGLLGQSSSGGKVMGTPEYMAPERAQGLGYDHRSDVYSLGVMAYEMLVGEVPLQGASPVETLAMQVDEQADRINERLTGPVPEQLEAVVMRMIHKDPLRRPQSMAEVEALLIEAQLEARIHTPWDEDLVLPPMDPDRAARIARRLSPTARSARTSLWVASSVAALSVVLALFFAFRDPDEAKVGVAVGTSPAQDSTPTLSVPLARSAERTQVGQPSYVSGPAPKPADDVRPGVAAPLPPPDDGGSGSEESPTPSATAPPGPTVHPPQASQESEPPSRFKRRREPRDPAKARAAVARGMEAFRLGRYTQAQKEYQAAVVADPGNVDALFGLAESQFENAEYEGAFRSARDAARRRHKPEYHVLLGHALYKLKRFPQALKAYERAAHLDPGNSSYQQYLQEIREKLAEAR